MNSKKTGIIAAVAAAVIIGIVASVMAYSSTPDVANSNNGDTVEVTDSAVVEESGQEYFIDEDGNKVYIIEAGDSPVIGDGG